MQTIEKQHLIKEPLEKETLKLAQAIYSTYIVNEKDPYMSIPVDKLYTLLGFEKTPDSLNKLIDVFVDLTEPIVVREFEYMGKRYEEIILTFCDFKIIEQDGHKQMEIEVNEMYLKAMKYYMTDPFLDIK